MEDMYTLVKDFFSHDMDLVDLFDSEAIIWIDWREDDEDVVRWFVESLGNDTLGFTVLSGAEWAKLEDEFGTDIVRYYFEPINLESNMFNLDMDEVSTLLELRENKR